MHFSTKFFFKWRDSTVRGEDRKKLAVAAYVIVNVFLSLLLCFWVGMMMMVQGWKFTILGTAIA